MKQGNSLLNRVWLGLGGNVGDVRNSLLGALSELQSNDEITIKSVSNLYKTPPWGDENQDWFLNACAEIETSLEPIALLDRVKQIEKKFKRKDARKWGPRTLDIDILVYEGVALRTKRLELPHPSIAGRAFVLLPLHDIAPKLGINGTSVTELLEKVDVSQIQQIGTLEAWRHDGQQDLSGD